MIFPEPTAEQRALRASSIALIERAMPLRRVREMAEAQARVDIEHRRLAGELGWFSLLGGPPDERSARLVAAAAVAEVRGAHLQPGTFVAANLLAAIGTDRPSSDELDRAGAAVSRGDAAISWVCTDAMGHWGTDVDAVTTDDGYRLDGVSGLVQDGHLVEWLLVRACVDGAIGNFLVAADAPGVSITALEGLDLTRRWSRVSFNNVQVPSRSRLPGDGVDTIEDRHLQIAATLTVCETVGAIDQLFASTVQYAKDRVAFGRPIGSFQAIKHLLADASVALETSKAMAEAAVVAVGTEAGDAAQIVSMAKSFIGDASLDVVNACWQTHGGIAYTWQHDFHLYLRRVTTDAALYGDPTWHREQLCRVEAS